jgi:hypothetical protein
VGEEAASILDGDRRERLVRGSNSASRVLAFAFLKILFTLENASSMGLKSGEARASP